MLQGKCAETCLRQPLIKLLFTSKEPQETLMRHEFWQFLHQSKDPFLSLQQPVIQVAPGINVTWHSNQLATCQQNFTEVNQRSRASSNSHLNTCLSGTPAPFSQTVEQYVSLCNMFQQIKVTNRISIAYIENTSFSLGKKILFFFPIGQLWFRTISRQLCRSHTRILELLQSYYFQHCITLNQNILTEPSL